MLLLPTALRALCAPGSAPRTAQGNHQHRNQNRKGSPPSHAGRRFDFGKLPLRRAWSAPGLSGSGLPACLHWARARCTNQTRAGNVSATPTCPCVLYTKQHTKANTHRKMSANPHSRKVRPSSEPRRPNVVRRHRSSRTEKRPRTLTRRSSHAPRKNTTPCPTTELTPVARGKAGQRGPTKNTTELTHVARGKAGPRRRPTCLGGSSRMIRPCNVKW